MHSYSLSMDHRKNNIEIRMIPQISILSQISLKGDDPYESLGLREDV